MPQLNSNIISFWIKEIEACEERQRVELITKNHYPFLINYYEGNQFPEDNVATRAKRLMMINEYFPNTNQLIYEIMFQYPDITLEATKPGAEKDAPIMKAALTYASKKLEMLEEMQLITFDMIMAGYGALEVAHINNKDTETVVSPETNQEGIVKKAVNKVKSFFNIEEEFEKTIPVQEAAYATPDETYLRRWNPLNVLFDYQAERFKDLRYIIKKIRMSHAKFKALYPLIGKQISGESGLVFSQQIDQSHRQIVTLYQIQVKKKGGVYENIFINKGWKMSEVDYYIRPYATNGFDIKVGSLHKYGKLYPVSLAQINKRVQDDINNYVTHIMDVAERNVPKRGIKRGEDKQDTLAALHSKKVNQAVPLESQNSVWQIPHTNVSIENKEVLALLNRASERGWTVPTQRLTGRGGEQFATELDIQQAGFQVNIIGIQQGLKKLWVQSIDSLKDIIVQFWDKPYWFKVTGQPGVDWYEPQFSGDGTLMNPLTDILIGDYDIDIDIVSAMRPNKEKKKADLIKFATWITSEAILTFAASQGKTVNIDVIKKVASEWGWNAESLLIDVQPPTPEGELPPEGEVPVEGAVPVQ